MEVSSEGDNTHDATASLLLRLSNSTHSTPNDRSSSSDAKLASAPTASLGNKSPPASALESAHSRRSQVAALPRKEWSAAEDELIKDGVERLGCRWRVIAAMLPGRSDDAVRNRWSRLQDSYRASSNRDGKSPDNTSGPASAGSGGCGDGGSGGGSGRAGGDGKAAAGESGRRDSRGESGAGAASSKSQRSGSKSHSKQSADEAGGKGSENAAPKKERTSWTRSEDDVIMQGVAELGHKWYEIARRLPGRTDHAIRNRWSRLQSIMCLQEGGGGVPPAGFVPTAGSVKSSLLKGLLNGAPSEPLSVGAAAGARTTSPEVHTTPVSLAALASVERAHVPPDPPMRTQNSDPTSNSDASEATMAMSAIGPAELLLLQSAPSCHTSPLLSSQPPSSREENGAEVAELLLLQRTPSCHASPLLTTAMGAGGGVDVPAELTSSATDQVMESESLQENLPEGAMALMLVNKRPRPAEVCSEYASLQ